MTTVGPTELLSNKRKARKDHVCSCCGLKIPKGSYYWRFDSIRRIDGVPHPVDVTREHLNCEDLTAGQK